MNMESGISFDGIHSSEFFLKLKNIYIPQPEPKTNKISIPGADGNIDLSEISGKVNYEDRDGVEFTFDFNGNYDAWFTYYSKLSGFLHGRKIRTILDDDPNYYYMCRLSVDGTKSNPVIGEIVLSGSADPYKYDITSSMDDWLWDSFNFETGVIREYKNISVYTSGYLDIPAGGVSVAPIFNVSSISGSLAVVYSGRSYSLKTGYNRIPQIRIGKTAVRLNFTGTGTFSIDYRGRYL